MPDFEMTRLASDNLSDFHCHCDYSIDAEGTVDDYCAAAIERGLAELCFTTHFDPNPNVVDNVGFVRIKGERKPATIANLAPYIDDVLRAQEQFFPLGLSVKLGVEFGWYPGCEEMALKLKQTYDFDYFLGGIHELEGVSFCCASQFEKCFSALAVERMAELYFGYAVQLARSGIFTTIAHLDYYRKYGEKYYGEPINSVHRPFIAELFEALKAGHTAIEINTAALRRGLSQFYPQMEIVNAARRAGVDVAYLGSDAHSPAQVGFEFDMASMLIPHTIGGCDD